MPLQTQIYLDAAKAVQGDKATLNPMVYTTLNPLAEVDITIGTFVWPGTDPEAQAKYGGTGEPMGFVERVIAYHDYDLKSEGTLVASEGSALTVARRGDYWAISATVATAGQKVFANTTDGTISTAAAGGTVAGAVETSWSVKSPGAIGELIVISNWDAQV